MPDKKKVVVKVMFAKNLCEANVHQLPKDGMIVVPARPNGSWYAICQTAALSGYLSAQMNASIERPVEGFTACSFKAGEDWSPAQLKYNLEEAGFNVTFTNKPPWLQK